MSRIGRTARARALACLLRVIFDGFSGGGWLWPAMPDNGILPVICPTCQMAAKLVRHRAGSHRLLCMGLFSSFFVERSQKPQVGPNLLPLQGRFTPSAAVASGCRNGPGPDQDKAWSP